MVFCYKYSADVLSLLTTRRFDLQERTAYEAVMNYTPDIFEYVSFTWFQWFYYFDESTKTKRLCCWMGPAHHNGQYFCSYVILDNAEFLAISSFIPVPAKDLSSDDMQNQMTLFMQSLESKIGNHKEPAFDSNNPNTIYFESFGDHIENDDNVLPYGDELIDAKVTAVDEAYL